jgi:hypothetical protein
VVSFFLLAAFERLLAWRSSGRVGNGVGVGAALGLAILAKGTAYFFAVPVFLFALATIVRKPLRYDVRVGIFIVPIVLAINAGHYYRNVAQFGTPLGPQYGVASLDHSPGALFSSFLRNIASNLATPSSRLNDRLVHGVVSFHHLLGLSADDPNTTFPETHFKLSNAITSSDVGAPNPLHLCLAALTIVLLGVGMLRPLSNSRQSSAVWAYSVAVLLGGMLFCAMLRWQPWITRLQLPLFVLMGPAVAAVLAARIPRRWIIIGGVCLILAALPSALLNHQRPLLGEPPRNFGHPYTISSAPNILSGNVWQEMFVGDTQKYIAYRDAVTSIANRASGGVGLALGANSLEYQFWRMLNEDRSRVPVHIEHVCLLENSSPGSTFQPEIVLATGRDQPAMLICTNGVFEKEARFPSGDPAPKFDISIYHRLRTGPRD